MRIPITIRKVAWGMRLALVAGLLTARAVAEEPSEAEEAPLYTAQVTQWTKERQAAARDNTNLFVRTGLVADWTEGCVELLAESTGVASGDPMEFLLIGPASGHDYEAVARSYCQPGDLRDALVFLGVPPGEGIDPSVLRQWPRGERIRVEVAFAVEASNEATSGETWIPAERLIIAEDKPLPAGSGFVFTGSYLVPDPADTNRRAIAADVSSPHSLIALYNEPQTVLDVPRIAPQGSVYGAQALNMEHASKERRLMRMRLTPELLSDGPRGVDVEMRVRGGMWRASNPFSGILVDARNLLDESSVADADLKEWLAFLERIQGQGRDIYLSVYPDRGMLLEAVARLYAFLEQLNVPRGARLNSAPSGEIYYRAFVPPPAFRERDQRPGQPWELHLYQAGPHSITGQLMRIEEIWNQEESAMSFKEHPFSVASPEDMRQVITENPDILKVVLVYAPETMTYGQMLAWYESLPPGYSTVYIYLRTTPDDIIPDDRHQGS